MEASRFTLLAISALVAISLPAAAVTIHVPDDQHTIQAGIDAASVGDTVLVACGTYYEHDILMKPGISLVSETGAADCVTIDAQQQGRVLLCDPVDDFTLLKGFTITGGYGAHGAGMACYDSNPTLTNIVFTGNSASGWSGGGLYAMYSSPTLTNVTFSGNTASGSGGGMYCRVSVASLTDVVFSDNEASAGGGMCEYWSSTTLNGVVFSANRAGGGGGMWTHSSSTSTLTDVVFSENSVEGSSCAGGGGLYCGTSASPVLTDVEFSNNTATGVWSRGALCCYEDCHPELTNVTFSGNSAVYGGGVTCNVSSFVLLTNCIIAFSEIGPAVLCDDTSGAALTCCDVYGNAGGDWVGYIAGQYGVSGNISENPLFCDPERNDLTLHADSPCAAENNPRCGLIGACPVGCPPSTGIAEMIETTSWGRIKAMHR